MVELICEIDQFSDNGSRRHNAQTDEHVESRVNLGEVLLREHSEWEGRRAGKPSPRKNPMKHEKDGKGFWIGREDSASSGDEGVK